MSEDTLPYGVERVDPPAVAAVQPGDLLAGRYRIVRFIARGGMGEVFEAADTELLEHVAIKIIRPELSYHQESRDRLRREIALARKVLHANVCRVLELGMHRTPSGTDLVFLTMELLAGETLEHRLKRNGRMTPKEAFPLLAQMAEALAAAHDAGVVHRDLKTANVMLVPVKGGERVVVTDFGLASQAGGGGPLASMTQTGIIVGTAAYMAPEQARGEPATARSDLYALGVVMYEMVTGARPHDADNAISILLKRVREPASSPRRLVPGLDLRWEAAILTCLAMRPEDRFRNARALVAFLRKDAGTRSSLWALPFLRIGRPSWGTPRALALAGAALVVLAAATVVSVRLLRDADATRADGNPRRAASASRRAVALVGFKNLSTRPEAEWISTALAEMLGTELAAGERLRTVSGESVSRMKVELALPSAESYAKDTLERIRANVGADVVVVGSYLVSAGGAIRLGLHVQDARDGESLATLTVEGTEEKLADLVARTGLRLREALGAGTVSPEAAAEVRATLPGNPEAARLYAEGLSRLRLFDALGARTLLEEAAAKEPQQPLVHAALAEALTALGYETRAAAEAKRAFDLSAGLPRADRLLVEARYRESRNEWSGAAEDYRLLFGFFSDELEYGLRLAAAETRAGKADAALRTVGALRGLPAPTSKDPRIDMAEAAAAMALTDLRRAEAAATRAVAGGNARGARLLAASARVMLGRVHLELGDPERARAMLEEARGTLASAGDRNGAARALSILGDIAYRRGDYARSRGLYEDALALQREAGNDAGVMVCLRGIANLLSEQGDLVKARETYARSLEVSRRIADRLGESAALMNTGIVALDQGSLAEAHGLLEQAVALKKELGEKRGVARATNALGDVLRMEGRLPEARSAYEAALALGEEVGQKSVSARSRQSLAHVLYEEGDLEGAARAYGAALAEFRELGSRIPVAEAQVALAVLRVEEGRPAEALPLLADALPALSGSILEARALATRARALAAGGGAAALVQAGEAAARARALTARSQQRPAAVLIAIEGARVDARVSPASAAVRTALESCRKEAREMGAPGLELEARLALAQAGRGDRALLAGVARDAERLGYRRIARKAAAAGGAR